MTRSKLVNAMLFVTVLFGSGCTAFRLRTTTIHQTRTIADIHHQQILDNLALFYTDPNATPHFALVTGGTTAVTDAGSIGSSVGWNALGFASAGLTPGASRQQAHNWSLKPIDDPVRLEIMRCTYQMVLGYQASHQCPDCCELLKKWHQKDEFCPDDSCRLCCLPGNGWFCVGCKKDVPRRACRVGCYCDTYVWVLPEGSDALHHLTMIILDYATRALPSPKSQQVVRTWIPTYDVDGNISDYKLKELQSTNNEPASNKIGQARKPSAGFHREESERQFTGTHVAPDGAPSPPQSSRSVPTTEGFPPREYNYDPIRGLINLPRP